MYNHDLKRIHFRTTFLEYLPKYVVSIKALRGLCILWHQFVHHDLLDAMEHHDPLGPYTRY